LLLFPLVEIKFTDEKREVVATAAGKVVGRAICVGNFPYANAFWRADGSDNRLMNWQRLAQVAAGGAGSSSVVIARA